jgi:hypothetical protein
MTATQIQGMSSGELAREWAVVQDFNALKLLKFAVS